MKWIKCSDELPPLYKRVFIWTRNSNLRDWNRDWVRCYAMTRIPEGIGGNHVLPYSYRCENSGMEFAHNVTHWAHIEGPNES